MKLPEKPPSFEAVKRAAEIGAEEIESLLNPSVQLKEVYKKANFDYLYWTKFKQLNFGSNIKPELAWWGLKLYRNNGMREIETNSSLATFSFSIIPSFQSTLSLIDQFAAGNISMSNYGDSLPLKNEKDSEKFILSSLMEEGIASSQIEGAATTRKKAKEMLRAGKKPKNKDQQMIVNNYITIRKIKEQWKDEPLSKELILKIHKQMTSKTMKNSHEEGRFRDSNDEKIYVIDEAQRILYDPPEANQVESMIESLCQFANKDHQDENYIHPVIKAIIIHFWIAWIHPFMDGNGRTARALFYWYMLSRNYWMFEFLSISRIILNARQKYEAAFIFSEYDGYDLNYFIKNQLDSIRKATEDLRVYLSKKQSEYSTSTRLLRSFSTLNDRQRGILLYALENRGYVFTVQSNMNVNGVSYETARKDLMKLADLKLMDMRKQGKKYIFVAVEHLEHVIKSKALDPA